MPNLQQAVAEIPWGQNKSFNSLTRIKRKMNISSGLTMFIFACNSPFEKGG